MAIISSGQLGKATGSIGNITYSVIEGRTIGRQKPSFVRNPNTEAQQLQRGKMAGVVGLYQQIGPVCTKTFTNRKKYSSAYNEFVSRNIHGEAAFGYQESLGLFLLGSDIVLGNGSLHNNTFTVGKTDGLKYGIQANNDVFKSALQVGDTVGVYVVSDDMATLLDYSHKLTSDDISTLRADGVVDLDFPVVDGSPIAGYWISADGRKSNSPTLGAAGTLQ